MIPEQAYDLSREVFMEMRTSIEGMCLRAIDRRIAELQAMERDIQRSTFRGAAIWIESHYPDNVAALAVAERLRADGCGAEVETFMKDARDRAMALYLSTDHLVSQACAEAIRKYGLRVEPEGDAAP